MAAALLGKCVGLLALVVLLYYCGRCYAFRVRDHPGQTAAATSAEQPLRGSSCTSMFGRCQEKTTTTSTASRKWRDATAPRLASTARKPPVELTSVDGHDAGTEGSRVRQVRPGRPVDRIDADDDGPSGSSRSVEAVDDEDDDDEDDDEVIVEVEEEDTVEEIVSDEEDEGNGDSDDQGTEVEDEEEREDEASEPAKTVRVARKVVGDTREDETKSEKVEFKRKASFEKGFREVIKSRKQDRAGKDEDEDESEEVEGAAPTPPPRALEKIRHADKDKARSTETAPVTEKPIVEPKEVSKAREVAKAEKKPEGKKSAEGAAKPAEATKKVEPAKITKSEFESSRPKAAMKPEEKAKTTVKQEPPKPGETAKQPAKKTAPVKVKEVERSDKGESKVKTKTHVEAPFTLSDLNDAILRVPTFVPNFTAVENVECQQHGRIFLRQLRGYKLWALQMLDASAKVPSGLLRGNVNQFGDFDECLGVVAHVKLNERTAHPSVTRGGVLVRIHNGAYGNGTAMEQRRDAERRALQEQRVDEFVVHTEFLSFRRDVCDAYPPVGIGHATVVTSSDVGILLRMQTNYRDSRHFFLPPTIGDASLRGNDEQLSFRRYFSWNVEHNLICFRLKHLYRTGNLIYILPLHRATPYVLGVGLGVLLRYTGRDVRIHKVFVILGWLIAMALGSWSLFSPWHLARRDYVYDAEEATNYAVISPVLWALALCWFILACYTNHGGMINRFLSSHWLMVFSRISYAVYLTQFAVFFHNAGTARYSSEFQIHRAIDPFEAAAVMAASIVLTLFFDLPMQEIKSVLMESTDALNVEVTGKEESTSGQPLAVSQKPSQPEQVREKKVFEEDEIASTGWDWQRDIVDGGTRFGHETVEDEEQVHVPILKKSDGRRQSFIGHELAETRTLSSWDRTEDLNKRSSADDDEYRDRRYRSRSGQRDSQESEGAASNLRRTTQREWEESVKRGGRSFSGSLDVKRSSTRDSEDEDEYPRRRESAEVAAERRKEEEEEEETEDDRRRHRRSQSGGRSATREPDDHRSWEFVGRERSSSRGADSKRLPSRSEEREPAQRQPRPPLLRSADARRTHSSESEDEHASLRRQFEKRQSSAEPRISDEEDWENELRIRRKQFMEKLTGQERDPLPDEGDSIPPRRRSSAEGRIALLKDPSADDNMDSWTISVGSRVAQLGSSQEPSEPEEDVAYERRREYREQAPPPREDTQSEEEVIWDASRRRSYTSSSQPTSMEEEDDASYNFVLTRDSKRVSLQDLSRLSQEESDLADSGWNIVRTEGSSSGGLYKRESIVKSQASEEDPEYLLPERPKLVQQEREHPFKKAWQMQKSRSDEEGSAYAIREPREQPRTEPKSRGDGSSAGEVKREYSAEQYEDTGAFADDESESITLARSRSTDTDENTRASSRSEETESAEMERSSDRSEANRASLKSSDVEEDSLRSNWPSEDEQLEAHKTGTRSKSEEAEWSWEREQT
ncbi:unnamed protein product [Xylocopa violacea]|uniref:Nose resistant-to-fluoxetine protein N-terminal domain-containing protein n=1 Tax=Xylocopa violacea TaxID=135666 RepID=A0ABP1P9M5_XYLVO